MEGKRGPGRPPKLDRLAVAGAGRRVLVNFDGYEWAALEEYRDAEQRRTGRRPAMSAVVRALVRDLGGLTERSPAA